MTAEIFGAAVDAAGPALVYVPRAVRLVPLNGLWVIQVKGPIGGWGFAQRLLIQDEAERILDAMLASGHYIDDTSTP